MGITWEEVEVAAQNRSEWRRSVAQSIHIGLNQGQVPTSEWHFLSIPSIDIFCMYVNDQAVRRLSAAGSHLSFVVQPAPLIIEMKRQLKTMKYFKDYLID